MPFEAVNALKYGGHYDGDRLCDAAQSLSEHGITLVPVNETGPVAEIATTLDISIYEAAYVALAQTLDTTVYTADGTLLDTLADDYSEFAAQSRPILTEVVIAECPTIPRREMREGIERSERESESLIG